VILQPGDAGADQGELAELLFEQMGLNKRESKDMVEAFFDLIVHAAWSRARRQAVGLRQLPDPPQGAAARAATRAPASDPHQGAQRGHLPRQPQAQGPVQGDSPC
jgi:hypothetical protein